MSRTKDNIPEQVPVDDEERYFPRVKAKSGDIYSKLLDFQKLGISLSKDSTNPHFKNSYADLNETLKKVKKPLNDLGVLIIQTATAEGLMTILRSEDGTEVNAFLPWIDGTSAQKRGSEITYFRRYELKSLLALDDDDDDGEKASETAVGAAVRQLARSKQDDYQEEDDINFD